jgi:hypothetical protein
VTFDGINDEVCADWPEQHRVRSQVFAPVPHSGSSSESLKCVEQLLDPTVGSVDIVRGDVLPDIV